MKFFDNKYLNKLSAAAKKNPRQRQHINIHKSYQDNSQRLFNALEPGTYIRPHRHLSDPKDELLIAIKGLMALIIFDDFGSVEEIHLLDPNGKKKSVIGVELSSNVWHTVLALEKNSILLEVKAGPFDPLKPKDLAAWAPDEESSLKKDYYECLNKLVLSSLNG